MVAAGIAPARRIERAVVLRVTRILDVDAPFAGEELAVAGVARRHDAVEHVDAAGDALDEVLRGAGAHEVTRPVVGQPPGGGVGHRVHLVDRLSDAQAANRVALEPDGHGGLRAFIAQILEDTSLDDAELGLSTVRYVHAVHVPGPERIQPLPAPRGPSYRPSHRRGDGIA